MHISEGVLSAPVLITGAVIAAGGISIGLKKMQMPEVPKTAVLTSAFFAASLIHVPIGPANFHLMLTGLLGVLLGWSAFPSIFVGLSLQAILFGYGGITTLGINTCVIGIPAVGAHYLFTAISCNDNPRRKTIASFAAGFGAILGSTALLVTALVTTGDPFIPVAKFAAAAHLPLMIIEGVITSASVGFLLKVRPEVLPCPTTAHA
jgi:cobalt/nickel transport system permease protein